MKSFSVQKVLAFKSTKFWAGFVRMAVRVFANNQPIQHAAASIVVIYTSESGRQTAILSPNSVPRRPNAFRLMDLHRETILKVVLCI